jgi:predicted DNA-binding transcriptional regulator YafY
MNDLRIEKESRDGVGLYEEADMAAYSNKVFGMFNGSERVVTIEFAEHLAHAVIDRFGKEVVLVPNREGYFSVTVSVVVSPQFFAWVCGFTDEARIIWPEDVAAMMKEHIKKVLELY